MSNIAVVVLDTVRADAFDRHFEWLPGSRFTHAWSTSHWTGAAHASLFTGRYPSEVGVTVHDWTLSTSVPTLAERLQTAGYDTNAFSANINVSPAYDYDRGFNSFEGTWRLSLPEPEIFNWFRHMEENDSSASIAYADGVRQILSGKYDVQQSLQLGVKHARHAYDIGDVDSGATAFQDYINRDGANVTDTDEHSTFLFANLMEAHQPYRVPSSHRSVKPYAMGPAFEATFRTRFTDPADAVAAGIDPNELDTPEITLDSDHATAAYDDSVSYLADIYRDVFETLREDFDYVITIADHGELFGTYDVWEHGYGVYPELLQIPLVITRGRDLRTYGSSAPVRTEYHGIATMRRDTLLERGYDPSAIDTVDTDYCGVVTDTAYGYETDEGFRIAGDETGVTADELKSVLQSLDDQIPDNRSDSNAVEVTAATRSQLEDLGYT
jgi:arylsulfatase